MTFTATPVFTGMAVREISAADTVTVFISIIRLFPILDSYVISEMCLNAAEEKCIETADECGF